MKLHRKNVAVSAEVTPCGVAPKAEALFLQLLTLAARDYAKDAGVSSAMAQVTIGGSGKVALAEATGRVTTVTPEHLIDPVLPPEVRGLVDLAVAFAHYRPTLVGRDFRRPPVINLVGPPGVGKTTTARAIAARLGKPIIETCFPDLESPYVGVGAQNMNSVFCDADQRDAVLYIDESETGLGTRHAARQGSEAAANSMKTKLLKLLDDHSNLVIFASNRFEDYDRAFVSRIVLTIRFPQPDQERREQLWKARLAATPIAPDVRMDELARIGAAMSGRDIDSAAWTANAMSLMAGRPQVERADLLAAIEVTGHSQPARAGSTTTTNDTNRKETT